MLAGNKAASKADVQKTSYTSPLYRFIGLVRRRDNLNKKTLINIP